MSRELRQQLGGKKKLLADVVEIKMDLNTSTLMKEIFPFNDQYNNYVPSSYTYNDFKSKDVNTSSYKMYTLAYQQYAKDHDYNLKSLTYHFVAPKVTRETFELAFVLNHGYGCCEPGRTCRQKSLFISQENGLFPIRARLILSPGRSCEKGAYGPICPLKRGGTTICPEDSIQPHLLQGCF